jgi:ABC-type ATPase with predicted acetyltransferase domain
LLELDGRVQRSFADEGDGKSCFSRWNVEARRVSKVFGAGFVHKTETVALQDFFFTISGETSSVTAIVGESGSAKTALISEDQWQIAVFQNTPAQFHRRPELARNMTDELRLLL